MVPLIEAHEGLSLEANSHSRTFRDRMWAKGGPAMEGLVAHDGGFFELLEQEFNEVMDDAGSASRAIDATNPVNITCSIEYFPEAGE